MDFVVTTSGGMAGHYDTALAHFGDWLAPQEPRMPIKVAGQGSGIG